MSIVIGFTGPAGSGKTTAASMLSNIIGAPVLSFAGPVKTMLAAGLRLTEEELYGPKKDSLHPLYGVTPRHLMQTLGTEWGRQQADQDLWVNAMSHTVEAYTEPVIIDDVRFGNEADFIRERGALYHVTGRGGWSGTHDSERGVKLAPGDFMLNNRDDLAELAVRVNLVAAGLQL